MKGIIWRRNRGAFTTGGKADACGLKSHPVTSASAGAIPEPWGVGVLMFGGECIVNSLRNDNLSLLLEEKVAAEG